MVRYTTDSTAMPAADSRPGTERGTAAQDLNVHELVPADAVDAPSDISLAIPFTFSIQRTYLQNWRSFVNGTSWEILPHGQSTLVSSTARDASLGTRVWPGYVLSLWLYPRILTSRFVVINSLRALMV